MKIKKLSLALAVAAVCSGTVAAVSATQFIQNNIDEHRNELSSRYKTQRFVVASRTVPAGSVIDVADLSVHAIIPDGIQADAILPSQMEELIGTTAKYELSPGAVVLQSQLNFSNYQGLVSLVDDGEKLITIAVNALSSISGMLEPEDRVDILFTDASGDHSSTVTLQTNMRVIATGQLVQAEQLNHQIDMGYNTVTLACEPAACQKLAHAQSRGELSLLLTRDATAGEIYPSSTTMDDLLGIIKPVSKKPGKPKPRLAKVQVYGAGQRIK